MTLLYADTSALVKLVIQEEESPALERWLDRRSVTLVSSELAFTELHRAVRRAGAEAETIVSAERILAALSLRRLTRPILRTAALLDPPHLRTLDAIHLATALELLGELEAVVTYDQRLGAAAEAYGVSVASPGG